MLQHTLWLAPVSHTSRVHQHCFIARAQHRVALKGRKSGDVLQGAVCSPAIDRALTDAPAKGSVVGVVGRQGQVINWEDVYVRTGFPALLQILDDLCTAVCPCEPPRTTGPPKSYRLIKQYGSTIEEGLDQHPNLPAGAWSIQYCNMHPAGLRRHQSAGEWAVTAQDRRVVMQALNMGTTAHYQGQGMLGGGDSRQSYLCHSSTLHATQSSLRWQECIPGSEHDCAHCHQVSLSLLSVENGQKRGRVAFAGP